MVTPGAAGGCVGLAAGADVAAGAWVSAGAAVAAWVSAGAAAEASAGTDAADDPALPLHAGSMAIIIIAASKRPIVFSFIFQSPCLL